MRTMLGITWLFAGLGAAIFHYGPGVELSELDTAGQLARRAHQAADEERWAESVELYEEAIGALPESRSSESVRLRLAKAKSQMMAAELPEAREALLGLLDETLEQHKEDRQLANDVRSALANSLYYTTWLMRLEGAPKAEWEPEIEAARQHYKVLSEDASQNGSAAETERHLKDLEASIRLARLDLKDLQGLPLPSQ